MTLCDFDGRTRVCLHCGYQARQLPTFRRCRPVPAVPDEWRPVLIGTLISRWLAVFGITSASIQAVTGKPCGCDARRGRLDDWGIRVQVWARRALTKVRKFVLGD